MQQKTLLATAIVGVLASSMASAAVDVYASGASAQRTFWFKEMGAQYCGGTSAITIFAYSDSNLTINNPDFQSATCNATVAGPGFTSGTQLNLHYAADLGSVWGIAGSLNTSLARSQMIVPASPFTGCTLKTSTSFPLNQYNCVPTTAGSYSRSADTGGSPFLSVQKSDLLLSDLEPSLFASADNWPTASAGTTNNGPAGFTGGSGDTTVTKLATQPNASQLAAVASNMSVINGEVFSFVGKNIPGSPTGLSVQSLRTIFQGGYATWNEVPEVGAADTASTPILVCRRDHGSGSEVAASVFLTGIECGLSGAAAIVNNNTFSGVALSYLIENASSTDLKTCITGAPAGIGTIGMLSLGTSSTYTTLNVDSVQPNAHNAALGAYGFYTETWGQNISTTTEGSSTAPAAQLATALFTAAQQQTRLSADGFTETPSVAAPASGAAGQYVVSAGTAQQVAFALPNSSNTASTANWAASAPVALFTKKGNSCTKTATNGNST